MDMNILLTTILQMTLMIGLGFFMSRFVPLTFEIKRFLTFFLINIAIPCLILNGMFQLEVDRTLVVQAITLFLFSTFIHITGILCGFFVAKRCRIGTDKAWQIGLLATLGNTGLIGIPLCTILYGAKGAFFAAIFDASMATVLYTVGVMLLKKERRFSLTAIKSLLNMPLAAIIVGSCIIFANIKPVAFMTDLTHSIASSATPLAMIYIGMLVFSIIKENKLNINREIIIPLIMKLTFIPVLAFILILFIPLPADILGIFFIQAAMPTMTSATIVFAMYRADENVAATVTVVSTILSLMTLPLLLSVFQSFG